MKIKNTLKYAGLAALVLTMAVGCASTPKEEATTEQTQSAVTAADAQKAIDDAKAAIAKAEAAGATWRDTDKLIEQAEAAMKAGDYAKAVELANEARRQAENALAQHEAEMSKMSADNYTVMRGDSLWAISGKSDIYGNPYQWPLIYKANRDKIKDADLIYPGQVFSIERNASAADISAAVNHAKTRGAWALGTVEASDKAYLNQ